MATPLVPDELWAVLEPLLPRSRRSPRAADLLRAPYVGQRHRSQTPESRLL